MSAPRPAGRDQKQSVRDQFGPVADRYAAAPVHRIGPDLDALIEALAPTGRERALDVGCGAGHTALTLAPAVAAVEALDLTQAMLDQVAALARSRGIEHVTPRLGDAEAMPYPEGRFDIVTCRLCAHHFARPGRAIAEMARVLAPGGRLVLIDIVAPERPEVDTFLNAIEIVRDPSHVRDHTIGQWRDLLGASGIEVTGVRTWPMRIEFEAWLTRMGAPDEAAAALRWMFGHASDEVVEHLEIDRQRFDFTLTNAMFTARRIA